MGFNSGFKGLNPFVTEVLIFVSAWKLSLQRLVGGVPLTFQSMLKNLKITSIS